MAGPIESIDQTLITRIMAGDRDAFGGFVRMYAPELLAYASRIAPPGTAEDLVQDVFCRIWDQRAILERVLSLRAYLFTSVRNAAFDATRRIRAEDRRETVFARQPTLPGMSTPPADLDEALMRDEMIAALRRAIAGLPERRREILMLRLQQLTYTEIARVMGISQKTVEAQVTQAFSALRTALRGWAKLAVFF